MQAVSSVDNDDISSFYDCFATSIINYEFSNVDNWAKISDYIDAYYKDLGGNEMEWFAEPCKILYELKAEQEE